MLRRLYKFYRNYHYCINGAAIGLIAGLLLVFAGIFKTIIILGCIFVGYYIGRRLQKDKNFVKKLLDKILPNGNEKK